MATSSCKAMDPRVRRTRQLLHEALDRLLEARSFEAISVQDIAEAATLNRATFYDHYPDKTALLRCHVALRFQTLLNVRGVRFDGTCGSALGAIALGVCDYLAGLQRGEAGGQPSLDPHLESAIIGVVKSLVLEGLKQHASGITISLGMAAAAASWAVYGGAKEWLETPGHPPSEEAALTIAALVQPVLAHLTQSQGEKQPPRTA